MDNILPETILPGGSAKLNSHCRQDKRNVGGGGGEWGGGGGGGGKKHTIIVGLQLLISQCRYYGPILNQPGNSNPHMAMHEHPN
jgi:hypothetical protein